MAAVDYSGIRDKLKDILEADARTSGARIFIEEEPQFGLADQQAVIAVFMDRRDAPAPSQGLAAGKRTRYFLRLSLWVVAFSLENYKGACDRRDEVLGNLELVLMANRTIGDKVTSAWLEGGEMFSARDAQNTVYTAAAETVLVCEVQTINT